MADQTHTIAAKRESRTRRQVDKLGASQARLADKSFSDFMRQHNAKRAALGLGQEP